MTAPEISVIVPVHNVEHYLEQCVESVLAQTFGNFEVLLINDGSTDRSPEMCDRYAALDPRVRVVHQTNRGLSGARNVGMQLARGNYICFLDSDDWLDPETLAEAFLVAEGSGADVVLWPYVREYKGLSLPKKIFDFEQRYFDAPEVRSILCRRMVGLFGEEIRAPENADSLVTACCKLYRSALLVASDSLFVDTALIGTEDALFNLQVFTEAKSSAYINRPFYHYRRDNESSLTTKYKSLLPEQWVQLHDRMRSHIQENELGEDFEQTLQNRISLSIIGIGLNALNAPTCRTSVTVIKDWLRAPEYRSAISTLPLKWLPFHWRVFFSAARWGNAWLAFGLLVTIRQLRVWRNRARS